MEAHITDITHVIQLAVAPVFLLTAIATLITGLNNRLGRIVDRRRVVEERLGQCAEQAAREFDAELNSLYRRTRLIYFAILSAVLAALLICVVVAGAFVGALLAIDAAKTIAVIFILAMLALILCLGLFLREV